MRPWVLISLCLLVVGCHGGGESDIVGTWRNVIRLTPAQRKAAGSDISADAWETDAYHVKADHTYEFSTGGLLDDKGTWTFGNGVLTTHTETINGHPLPEFRQLLLKSKLAKTKPDLLKTLLKNLDKDGHHKLSGDGKKLEDMDLDEFKPGDPVPSYRKDP
jgi:hypothetical protein